MGSKTLTIKTKVYKDLISIKKKDESFSDLFERLVKEKKPALKKYFGILKMNDEDFSKTKENMKKFRKEFEESWNERLNNLK